MEVIYRTATGSQATRPEEVDETSSVVVRLRKNIERVTVEDPTTGETTMLWQYDEAILTKEEYSRKIADDNTAKLEYIAMMTDVDLEEE